MKRGEEFSPELVSFLGGEIEDWEADESENENYEPLKWEINNRSKRAVYQLKVSLKGSKPGIWRRIILMNTIKLSQLHEIIQVAMGWENYHLYEFIQGNKHFSQPHEYSEMETYDVNEVQLRDLLFKEKGKLTYIYDFGDNWQHQIVLEKISVASRENTPVQVLKGVGACPPEDVGSIGGYGRMLNILKNPNHEEFDEFMEWLGLEDGEIFDPLLFEISEVNAQLDENFN